jgi:hypothetical protein
LTLLNSCVFAKEPSASGSTSRRSTSAIIPQGATFGLVATSSPPSPVSLLVVAPNRRCTKSSLRSCQLAKNRMTFRNPQTRCGLNVVPSYFADRLPSRLSSLELSNLGATLQQSRSVPLNDLKFWGLISSIDFASDSCRNEPRLAPDAWHNRAPCGNNHPHERTRQVVSVQPEQVDNCLARIEQNNPTAQHHSRPVSR